MSLDLFLLILLLVAGFYMAWNIGANDVSNAMGTSVGSGALTLRKAVIIAGILEFCGAFFLGSHVSQTVQKGLVNPDVFAQDPTILLYGMLSALIATALWLQTASYFGWPVSTTHAIIGAILGFGVIVGGVHAVEWPEVGNIALSWVISPLLSGVIAFALFTIVQKVILFAYYPIDATKRAIPIFTALLFLTFFLNFLTKGIGGVNIHITPTMTVVISCVIAVIAFIGSKLFVHSKRFAFDGESPPPNLIQHVYSLNKALKHLQRVKLATQGERREEVASILRDLRGVTDQVRHESGFYVKSNEFQIVEKMFASLQILSAMYIAFAHGANDVANAIGPVAASLEILRSGALQASSQVPSWLLALGGVGIVIGLATWGWRVMETIGKKITELTPTRGFCAEFGAASTILLASRLGLPISTTHCIVGAVLGVGTARGISALNLRTVREIVLSWIITIPSSAIVCILLFYLLRLIF